MAIFGNPLFGKLSDRTSSEYGMRRPWMVIGLVGGSVGILVVALAPNAAGAFAIIGAFAILPVKRVL